MGRLSGFLRILLSLALVFTILPLPREAKAQDLVATEDLSDGSSVFVFRESRKKPQAKFGGGRVTIRVAVGRVSSGRAKGGQIASAASKRRAAAIAARKKTAAAADRRIALSNTLTIKAEVFLDGNQIDLAITNYRAALVQYPKNTRASEGLSNALTSKGIDVAGDTNNIAAIVYFDEAIKFDKQNDVAWAKLGAIYDATGQRDKAIVSYEKALAINADYTLLYASLGIAYIEAGEIAKAEQQSQRCDAAGIDNAESRFLRALVLFKQNRNEEALAAIDRTLELEGRFIEAQYYRGQILDRMGRSDQAIVAYKGALATDPTFTPAGFDLGVAYYNAGDYNDAAAAYQDVVKNDPSNAEAHANLASTYRQLERYPEANGEYKQAEIGVKTPDLYSEWGYCLGKTSEWDKSVARLNTAAEMSPSAIDNSNLGWGYYNAAKTQTAAKNDTAAAANYNLAKTYLQKAVDQNPRLDAAYLNLGSTHNALGEFQLAVGMLNTALGLHNDWVIAINQLGLGYRGLKDFGNAIATLKRAVALDGRNTYGLYNLGEAYYASGNKNEAKKINDRLKKIDPTLAARLDNVIAGRLVDAAVQRVEQKIPVRIPRFP
jgi:tetratricopeptide (TPR) repeat protein